MPIVWLSLDPRTNNINFYPSSISRKIEDHYTNSLNTMPYNLGEDFFNATIHFHITTNENFYQTTKAKYYDNKQVKPPGFRSVKRIELTSNSNSNVIKIRTKKFINNEWRITNRPFDHEIIVEIPPEVII